MIDLCIRYECQCCWTFSSFSFHRDANPHDALLRLAAAHQFNSKEQNGAGHCELPMEHLRFKAEFPQDEKSRRFAHLVEFVAFLRLHPQNPTCELEWSPRDEGYTYIVKGLRDSAGHLLPATFDRKLWAAMPDATPRTDAEHSTAAIRADIKRRYHFGEISYNDWRRSLGLQPVAPPDKLTFECVLPLGTSDARGDVLDPASKVHVQEVPSGFGVDLPKSAQVTSVSPVPGHEGVVSIGFTVDDDVSPGVDDTSDLNALLKQIRDARPSAKAAAEPKQETWRDREPLL